MSLGHALAAAANGEAIDSRPLALLEQAAREAWRRARAAYPNVALDAERFFDHVCARLPEGADPAAALRTLAIDDLYLACACAHGDPMALQSFEQVFMGRVDAYLARERSLVSMSDELKQALRVRLLVADGGVLPRIGQYTGRGPLGAWVWMTVTRLALDLRKASKDVATDPLALLVERTAVPDPELGYLKAHYGAEFREIYRAVLAALPTRESTVLRLHFLEGMTPEQVGRLYGVSRWTASRWIAATCQAVLRATRTRLAERLGVPDQQLDSLIDLVRSELALTLGDALATPH